MAALLIAAIVQAQPVDEAVIKPAEAVPKTPAEVLMEKGDVFDLKFQAESCAELLSTGVTTGAQERAPAAAHRSAVPLSDGRGERE
jgi:hypothetical protein